MFKSAFIILFLSEIFFCVKQKKDIPVVEYTQMHFESYMAASRLEFDNAASIIETIKRESPENLASLHLENYIDFYRIMTTDNEAFFREAEAQKKLRIDKIKKYLPDTNPYKKYIIAEIHLQWAVMRARFGQIFKSSQEVLSAYTLLLENRKDFPEFLPDNTAMSVLFALVESLELPGIIKKITGLNASIDMANAEINELILASHCDDFIFFKEAKAVEILIRLHQMNDMDLAIKKLSDSCLIEDTDALSAYLKTHVYQNCGDTDRASAELEKFSCKYNSQSFPYMEYLMGLVKLNKLDPSCIEHFERFLKDYKGQHFIKEAMQKRAWAALIFEEKKDTYSYWMDKCKITGSKVLDGDQQAYQEAVNEQLPDVNLLKARLLFDGAYYKRSLELLETSEHDNAEYSYRRARNLQALGKYQEAIVLYKELIGNNALTENYFSCNSALQMGIIYEKLNNEVKARESFNKCLSLKPDQYKRSLHQKARSGLERLEKW